MKKGFTLIEMLVVVLILGILASIALPQYEVAIEKSRVAEALVVLKTIVDAEQRYFQANPNDTKVTWRSQIADVDLKGGCWVDGGSTFGGDSYRTRNFTYDLGGNNGHVIVLRLDRDGDPCAGGEVTDPEFSMYKMTWGPDESRECGTPDGDETMEAICKFVKAMN